MKRLLLFVVVAGLMSCAHQDLTKPSSQDDFGVQMAKQNLWREAMFRFQRAVDMNPSDAQAHNNLAVAYEANGDFEKARKEYLEALKLDRSNQYIQKNYSRFVEFLSRNRKRERKEAGTSTASTLPATTAKPATTAAAPAPPAIETPPGTPPPGAPPVATPINAPTPTPAGPLNQPVQPAPVPPPAGVTPPAAGQNPPGGAL